MPSIRAMTAMGVIGGGAALGGVLGWRKADKDQLDMNDRFAFTTSSVVAGAVGGGVLSVVGAGGLYRGSKAAYSVAKGVGTAAMWNPLRPLATKLGRKNFGYKAIPKVMRKPLLGLAMLAGGIGAIAYGARSNPQTAAYATRDQAGGTEYTDQPVRERMDMLKTAGDMVFGLHNSRHG